MHPSTERCPCCQSAELGPMTKLDPSEGNTYLYFSLKVPQPGFFGEKQVRHPVNRARVCLGCGHVMVFLSTLHLQQLRERLTELEALPE